MKFFTFLQITAIGALTALPPWPSLAQSAAAQGFVVLEFTIKDPDGFRDYAQRTPSTVQQYGGRFIVRPGKIAGVAGEAPKGAFAILAFPTVEQAQKWVSSPEYAALKTLRDRSAEARIFIVEGTAP